MNTIKVNTDNNTERRRVMNACHAMMVALETMYDNALMDEQAINDAFSIVDTVNRSAWASGWISDAAELEWMQTIGIDPTKF